MANGLNRWCGFGNITEDGDLRVTGGGQAVLKFTVACNETYKDKNDQRQERCEYVRCTLWGRRADALAQYMRKGTKVYVEGSLRTTSTEKDGVKRYFTEVNVTEILLAGSGKRDDSEAPRERRGGGTRQQAPAVPSDAGGDDYGGGDDPIPF